MALERSFHNIFEVLQGQSKLINAFKSSLHYIETSLLTCTANQMTGFYMKCNIGLKWVKQKITMNSSVN